MAGAEPSGSRRSDDRPAVAVVIPYYQRERGVLRRSVASVLAQDCPHRLHVLVVDDGSPVPADVEVGDLHGPPGVTIEIRKQVNGGPGAARNAALDALPKGLDFVAFLDSDDHWSSSHLSRALFALESTDCDFYFANLYQLGQTIDAFSRAGRITPAGHPELDGLHRGLHRYVGDMFDQIMRGNVIGTSTVVYRYRRFSGLRFRDDLTRAGEDYLFWMAIVQAGARIVFSSEIEATYGKGVNVYSGVEWGSDAYFARVRDEITYRKATRRLFNVSPSQEAYLDRSIRELRNGFAAAVLSRLRHGPLLSGRMLARQVIMDPPLLWAMPAKAMRVLLGAR